MTTMLPIKIIKLNLFSWILIKIKMKIAILQINNTGKVLLMNYKNRLNFFKIINRKNRFHHISN